MLAAVLLGVTSMLLGLVVSAIVRTTEKTMPLLVLITIVEVVFCGSLFPLFHSPALEQLAWLSPSRWAVAAEAATINLPSIMGPPQGRTTTDPLWQHSIMQWGVDIGMLVCWARRAWRWCCGCCGDTSPRCCGAAEVRLQQVAVAHGSSWRLPEAHSAVE